MTDKIKQNFYEECRTSESILKLKPFWNSNILRPQRMNIVRVNSFRLRPQRMNKDRVNS